MIEGENFLVNGEHLEVYFDKFKAEIIQAGSSQIQVVVPSTYASYSLIPELLMFITVTNGLKEAKFDRGFLLKSSWEEKTPYISNYNHMSRSGFSYGLNGYLVDLNGNRLLEYSPELDQWSDFSDYHGKYTSKSLFVESKGKILQFGGGDMENFWEFDVNNKVWHQKNDLPFYFDHATNFRVENVEYIITNHGQFWSYNLDNELLNRLNNFPETFGNFAFAFVNNGVPYAITYGTTWQYDIVNDVWEVKSLNSIHRSSYSVDALGFMLEDQCYILQNGQDIYKYDLVNDRWVLSSRYPGCRGDNSIKTTFLVDDKIYIAAVASNYGGCAPLLFSFQR